MIDRHIFRGLAIAWLMIAAPARADDAADLAVAAAAFEAGDYAKGMSLIQAMADRGSPEGMRALGVIFLQGRGVAKDEAKGASWVIKSAEKGFAPSQHETGLLYMNGVGVAKDAAKAVAWFQKSADQGFGASWQALGRLAFDDGKAKDAEEAFRKASKLGTVGAMLDLAQNLLTQSAQMPSKEQKVTALAEGYQWIQTALFAIPTGTTRDEVHRQRLTIEDQIKKLDAEGAPRILADAKKEGESYAMKLRAEQTAAIPATAKPAAKP